MLKREQEAWSVEELVVRMMVGPRIESVPDGQLREAWESEVQGAAGMDGSQVFELSKKAILFETRGKMQ